MNQITIGLLKAAIAQFERENPGVNINNIPVYLGDDEELNGVHEAYEAGEARRDDPRDGFIFNNIDAYSWGEDTSKIKTIFLIS